MPNISATKAPHLAAFLAAADYFEGLQESGENTFTDPRGAEMLSLAGASSGQPWCAIFVSACAAKAGIDWVIIAQGTGVGGVTSNSVDYLDAKWIDGPYFTDGSVTPMPGDLISFVGSPAWEYSGYEHGGHIGIVEYVDDEGIVHTIEGNSGNECRRNTYSPDNTGINGYCRPDWAKVGDDVSEYLVAAGYSAVRGPLYQDRNDRHDMTIRGVGYLDTDYKLSDTVSNIGISVINYTTLLGDLYNMFAANVQNRVTVDTSQLTGNIKIAMDFFLSMGYSASASAGITGCLQKFSNVSPSFIKNLGMVNNIQRRIGGVAAWNNEKLSDINTKLGYGWNTNLSGQLEYLISELNTEYADLVSAIKPAALSLVAVDQVVIAFINGYNDYFLESAIPEAKKYAAEIYNQLIISRESTVGSIDNLRNEAGDLLESQFSVTVPLDIQSGILYDPDFSSYSYLYHFWGRSTVQRQVADTWAWQGHPCDKGIAMVGGYYCVAVKPKFGSVGDVIVVTLEDGTAFAAIIADEKGDDAKSEWGHEKAEGISVVEWERVKTDEYGAVMTEDVSSGSDVDYLGYGGGDDLIPEWHKKKVVNITNYGSYF